MWNPARSTPLLMAASLACAGLLAACSRPPKAEEPVRAVRTLTVGLESAGAALEFAADVRARTESRLGFRVGGKLLRRPTDLGQVVRPGEVLAQLDPQDLHLAQEAARAQLASAQAQLDQAAADFKRYQELEQKGFISAAELERRSTTLKSAQAQYQQAQAQLGVQGNQAAYASLVADAGGVITGVEAEPGQVVSAGQTVVRLAHHGPRDVVFSVPEDKVELLKTASRVQVKLWGSSNGPVAARIREVAAAADPVTRTYLVKADVGHAPVRLGQTATVTLELPARRGVAKLPLSALIERQGKTSVWLVDRQAMTVSPVPVDVAGADGNVAVIAGGLAPGQMVVTAGVHVLSPGQKVRLYGAAPSATNGGGGSAQALATPDAIPVKANR